jgi:hypothetical protein
MRKIKRRPKKLFMGGLAVASQVVGGLANIGIGIGQRIKGKKAYEQGREDFIGGLGPSDALASFTDENKALANRAGDLSNEKSDSALAGLLAANKAGDPRFMSAIGVDQIAGAEQDRGLKTAQGIAAASAPLVQAEEKAKDQLTGLYGQDMAMGSDAFNQGTQNIMGGASSLLNMPTDILTAQTAGVDFGEWAGKYGGLFGKGKEKSYAAGGLIGMGGMSMKGFEHLGKKDSEKKIDKVKELLDDSEYKSPRGRKTKGSSYDFRNETLDVDAPTYNSIDIDKMIHESAMKRKQNSGKPSTEGSYEPGSGYGPRGGKEGGYFNNQYASGGTIQQLIAEGGSFITPGKEDHDEQEFDIVDSETGEVIAKTTGQERHEDSEDGMSVTNSDQDQGMRDAFSSVRDKKNPTLEELRMLYEANHRVYSQPKFA